MGTRDEKDIQAWLMLGLGTRREQQVLRMPHSIGTETEEYKVTLSSWTQIKHEEVSHLRAVFYSYMI